MSFCPVWFSWVTFLYSPFLLNVFRLNTILMNVVSLYRVRMKPCRFKMFFNQFQTSTGKTTQPRTRLQSWPADSLPWTRTSSSNWVPTMRYAGWKQHQIWSNFSMEQHILRNVNNYLNTNIYSYLETLGGKSSNLYLKVVHFLNASVN